MAKLILVRHGQSEWNAKNLFTGWIDVPLSNKGIEEAYRAGESIGHIPIHCVFTSSLIRAHMTATLAMSRHTTEKILVFIHEEGKQKEWSQSYGVDLERDCIPVYQSWHLNERMYGKLQGLNKAETAERYGADQVHQWRRSYDIPPPEGESLELTAKRTVPYFQERVLPVLQEQKNVAIFAHGNSLRSIVQYLDQLSREEVLRLEIPTGEPWIYEYKEGNWKRENASKEQKECEKFT